MLKDGVQNLGAGASFPKGEGFPTRAGPPVLPRSWFLSQGGALLFFSQVPNLLFALRIAFPCHAAVLAHDRASYFTGEYESLRPFPSAHSLGFHEPSLPMASADGGPVTCLPHPFSQHRCSCLCNCLHSRPPTSSVTRWNRNQLLH